MHDEQFSLAALEAYMTNTPHPITEAESASFPNATTALTERQAEAALTLAARTLTSRRLLRRSVPPYVKIGRRVVYPVHLLRAWMDAQASQCRVEG